MENRLKYGKEDLARTREKLEKEQKQLAALDAEIRSSVPELQG